MKKKKIVKKNLDKKVLRRDFKKDLHDRVKRVSEKKRHSIGDLDKRIFLKKKEEFDEKLKKDQVEKIKSSDSIELEIKNNKAMEKLVEDEKAKTILKILELERERPVNEANNTNYNVENGIKNVLEEKEKQGQPTSKREYLKSIGKEALKHGLGAGISFLTGGYVGLGAYAGSQALRQLA